MQKRVCVHLHASVAERSFTPSTMQTVDFMSKHGIVRFRRRRQIKVVNRQRRQQGLRRQGVPVVVVGRVRSVIGVSLQVVYRVAGGRKVRCIMPLWVSRMSPCGSGRPAVIVGQPPKRCIDRGKSQGHEGYCSMFLRAKHGEGARVQWEPCSSVWRVLHETTMEVSSEAHGIKGWMIKSQFEGRQDADAPRGERRG